MDADVFDKSMLTFVCNLMDFYNEDKKADNLTDEFGCPLKECYYEVSAYDIDKDDKKELIFSMGNKKDSLVIYVFEVNKDRSGIKIKLKSSYYGGKYAYIDENNRIQIVK